MDRLGTFCLITVLCFSIGKAQTFVTVVCTAESVGEYGKHTMLECVVQFTRKDTNIVTVTWKKEGVRKPLLAYKRINNTAVHYGKEPGYQFAVESWNDSNTNVSLLITNTEMTHAGKYQCTVITDRGWHTGSTNLKVTAKYNKPTIQQIVSSSENGFECRSDGGYPSGELHWIVDDEPWQQVIETDVKKTQSGLYNLSSKLMLLKDSPFSRFTCVVFNGTGEKENEATFEIPESQGQGSERQRSPAEIVAPLVVIGSLIVGLLLVLFFRRRSQQARRFSATPLMREPQVYQCDYNVEQGADQDMVDKSEEQSCLRG